MYIKLVDNTPVSYDINQLKRDNPQVSFPTTIPANVLEDYDVYPLNSTKQPEYNPDTQKLTIGTPVQKNGEWFENWVITNKSESEIEFELNQWRENMKVSPLQIRRALRQQGLYESILDYISKQDPEIQDAWEYAIEIQRNDLLIIMAADELGYEPVEVDNIFKLAYNL